MQTINEIHDQLFAELRRDVAILDPVAFAENYLMIDGNPFEMTGNGWKFMADVYREVALQATNAQNEDGTYKSKPVVILKGRQVGATILAAVLSLYFTSSGLYGSGPNRPPIRVMHAFPSLNNMSKYVKDKLSYMIQNSQGGYVAKRAIKYDKIYGKDAPEDTLTEKTFVGFNKLRVDSIGKDADRFRGLSQDVLLCDEVQDMSQEAIENALRILTSAKYGPQTKGVQLYFGTPKQAGSYFWELWQDSDQRFYQLRCTGCGHFFFLYTMGSQEWRDIWIHTNIIKCPECGHEQEKKDAIEGGKWVATRPNARLIGFHMNVLLNPIYTRESVLDNDPDINSTRSIRAWENETLGNFFSTSNMTLTLDQIKASCLNHDRHLAKAVNENSEKVYVMGIDWGGKVESEKETRGQSYTVIAILSVDNKGVFTVENAWRLARDDLEYKIEVLQHLFRTFKIKIAVADFMWGNDIVGHMQNALQYGNRFLGCINSGSLGTILSYKPKELRVTLNKDMMLDEIFGLFRKGKIQFPAKGDSYERIIWLLEHCTSMEITTAQRYGSPIKKYEKGLGPNDGLMAIMYAVVAYKFLVTNGFKDAGGNSKDGPRPMPTLAFVPKMQ